MKIIFEALIEENDGRIPFGKEVIIDTKKLPQKIIYAEMPFVSGDIQGFLSITVKKQGSNELEQFDTGIKLPCIEDGK